MTKTCELIVMGGSWGGLNAVTKILEGLPKAFSIPIVIVLHRGKHHQSYLESLLQAKTALRVKETEEKEKILAGYVYLAPANYHLLIEEDRTFSFDLSAPVHYSRPSIDVTFESVAEVFGKRAAGIILTGANQDGATGLQAIAASGGITLVQDPAEAESSVMPQAALDKSPSHSVLSLAQINFFLMELHSGGRMVN
jgi:two-component system chemotaxis response regulator CheB